MWSIERFIIARDCETRLALTGTESSVSPVIRALRQGVVTGVLPDEKTIRSGCNPQSLLRAWQRILNTMRKADAVIPVATRVYCDNNGVTGIEDPDCVKICLDFVSIHGKTAKVFWVTNKKFQGTPELKAAYTGIATALSQVLDVRSVQVIELILVPMIKKSRNGSERSCEAVHEYDILQAPGFEVKPDASVFKLLLKLPHGGRSDRRKCLLATDPCPARAGCPVMNPR